MIRKFLITLFVFAFLQIPFFMEQYQQHLEGHLKELIYYRQQLLAEAESHGLTLAPYVAHFSSNSDSVIKGQGELMQRFLDRLESYQAAFTALKEAHPWSRPFFFIRHSDMSLLGETISSFSLGLSLTLENLCYALVGLLLGLLLFRKKKVNSQGDSKK